MPSPAFPSGDVAAQFVDTLRIVLANAGPRHLLLDAGSNLPENTLLGNKHIFVNV